jgi:hypothetical protein
MMDLEKETTNSKNTTQQLHHSSQWVLMNWTTHEHVAWKLQN